MINCSIKFHINNGNIILLNNNSFHLLVGQGPPRSAVQHSNLHLLKSDDVFFDFNYLFGICTYAINHLPDFLGLDGSLQFLVRQLLRSLQHPKPVLLHCHRGAPDNTWFPSKYVPYLFTQQNLQPGKNSQAPALNLACVGGCSSKNQFRLNVSGLFIRIAGIILFNRIINFPRYGNLLIGNYTSYISNFLSPFGSSHINNLQTNTGSFICTTYVGGKFYRLAYQSLFNLLSFLFPNEVCQL